MWHGVGTTPTTPTPRGLFRFVVLMHRGATQGAHLTDPSYVPEEKGTYL